MWNPVPELNGQILLEEETYRIRFSRAGPVIKLDATVVAIRHGETNWNAVEDSWQGAGNAKKNQLNDHGIEQAERAARLLFRQIRGSLTTKASIRKRFSKLVIISSELDRAKETAAIFLSYAKHELKKLDINFTLKVKKDRRLDEISFGFWDNKTLGEIEQLEPEQAALARKYMQLSALVRANKGRKKGECFLDVVCRGLEVLKELQRPVYTDKIILLFSSAVIINALRVSLGDQAMENHDGVIDWRAYSSPHGRQTLLTEGRSGSWFGDLDSVVSRFSNEMDLSLREDLMKKFLQEFVCQMRAAKGGNHSASLAMEQGFFSRPISLKGGKYMGVDVGGTYLRTALVDVTLDGRLDEASLVFEEFVIPDHLKVANRYRSAKGNDIFRFIAGRIEQTLAASSDPDAQYKIGLTFAFPMRLTSASSGRLTEAMASIKGWTMPDLVDKDPAQTLQKVLAARQLGHLKIYALADDTVGTLIAGEILNAHAYGAGVVGTGMDVAIWENDSVVDVAAGRFNLKSCREIVTSFDRLVDRHSGNSGQRLLEKMIAGKFMPELLRVILVEFIHNESLFDGHSSSVLESSYHEQENPQGFRAQDLSSMILDKRELETVQRILERVGIRESSLEERIHVRRIAQLILTRSAQLTALTLAATIKYADSKTAQEYSFMFDGNIVGRGVGYQKILRDTLKVMLGTRRAERIRICYRKYSSAIGGCIMAAMVNSQPVAKRKRA